MKSSLDWEGLLLGSEPLGFLFEVALRTFIMFVFILLALRMSGKRGIQQLSVFELVIIIGLGSAAGDPMFYKEVGILPALLVFIVIVALYRLVTWLMVRSTSFERLVEGEPICLIREGRFSIHDFDKEDLSQDEFFAELRHHNLEHLGQVKSALLETSGIISVLFYPDEEIRAGLPLYPDLYKKKTKDINYEDLYACAHCGNTERLSAPASCSICEKTEWVAAIDTKRIS